jgi:diguanylate cyclase (GGDEF)-like protein/PAS domain S-box-containing protein
MDENAYKREIKELKNSQMLLTACLENLNNIMIFLIDKNYNYLFFNEKYKVFMQKIYGKEILLGMNLLDYITSDEEKNCFVKKYKIALRGTTHTAIETYGKSPVCYHETYYNPIKVENNKIIGVSVFAIDISERIRYEQALKESENKYKSLYTEMDQGFGLHEIVLDEENKPVDFIFLDFNKSYLKMFGIKRKAIFGKKVKEIMPNIEQRWIETFGRVALTGDPCYFENYFGATGKYFSVYAYRPRYKQVAVLLLDISKNFNKEEIANYIDNHDVLTGLYDRRFYEEELLRFDTERNLPFTIVMGDMNALKLVNDTYGHVVGDKLLKSAAEAMQEGCRAGDVIARIGGDEFVILLPNTDSIEAKRVISRINEKAKKKKVGYVEVSISFGYKTKTNSKQKINDVFKEAEDYMYQHKLKESALLKDRLIEITMQTLFEKNDKERQHSEKVAEICREIAINMGFDHKSISQIEMAGRMHDIGKIAIDENILSDTKNLSNRQWREVKKLSEIGYRILISSGELSEIAQYILEHHEKWDGSGYPKGLIGKEISPFGRIIAIADAFDAMTRERNYKKVLNKEEAIEEIKRGMGTQFDPEIAKIFIEKIL